MNTIIILYIALFVILVVLLLVFLKNRLNKASYNSLSFPIDDLIIYLGGKDNIIKYQTSLSKITFKVKDNSLVNVEKIKELGASGIVETSDGFSFIFGNISSTIGVYLDNVMK